MNIKDVSVSEMSEVGSAMKENLAAAESSIRDIDMAKEAMRSIKNNILLNPSEAILAQASHLPQDAE